MPIGGPLIEVYVATLSGAVLEVSYLYNYIVFMKLRPSLWVCGLWQCCCGNMLSVCCCHEYNYDLYDSREWLSNSFSQKMIIKIKVQGIRSGGSHNNIHSLLITLLVTPTFCKVLFMGTYNYLDIIVVLK